MAPEIETTRALVLTSVESRDDRIVTMLTESLGRVPAVARHARRSKKRLLGAHVDPLTLAEVNLAVDPNRSLARLRDAAAVWSFPIVRGDLLRFALASTMAEVVLHLLPEYHHEPAVYELTNNAWRYLDDPAHRVGEDHLLLFELRALQVAGLLPAVAEIGGLGAEAREVLERWLAGRWRPLSPGDRRAVRTVLEGHLAEHSGRRLRSRGFLDEVLAGP